MKWLQVLSLATTYISVVLSETIAQIQGNKFQSPLNGQSVTVTGVVTAKAPGRGFFLDDGSSSDPEISSGLHIYITANITVSVNQTVTLNGTVLEYRPSSKPNDLYATRITNPTIITAGAPPRQLTDLDVGPDGYLSIPNGGNRVTANTTLQPSLNGLDLWESLEGQLVTIPQPIAAGLNSLDSNNSNTGFWVYGQGWNVTSKNSRGGLTITIGPDGKPDANPQAILIRRPLDITTSGVGLPSVALGTTLNDITGIVYYSDGHFSVLPLTAPVVTSVASGFARPTNITSNSSSTMISFGNYNVNNLAPNESTRLSAIADHIVNYLKTPDIVFLQEIQDNSGPIDDGTVSGNITLANLVNAITRVGNVTYASIEIAPNNNQDGGLPGGNIRQAYLLSPFRPAGTVSGTANDSVQLNTTGILNYNPGRIDPMNTDWSKSRKPLVAQWQTIPDNKTLFTINVHMANKGRSSTNWGEARPPINGNVAQRQAQIKLVATFVQSILKVDPNANILVGGDFNEYSQAREVFKSLVDAPLTEAVPLSEVEHYSHVFYQNCGALDHVFASKALVDCRTGVTFEHVHVNTWATNATTRELRISDHDPSVGLINLC
ncbi:hypothetical protein J132_03632 [Termitomyces sp. J132]|nr:hypothetical protein J132_03632 [Termitomyces sp. J132]